MKTFSLADLIPEPLNFTDDAFGGSGIRYDVLTLELLSSQDIAILRRTKKRINEFMQTKDSASDPLEPKMNTDALEREINALFKILIPKIGIDRIKEIPLGAKEKFFYWWLNENSKKKKRKEEKEAQEEK